jgi:hypothetical protein
MQPPASLLKLTLAQQRWQMGAWLAAVVGA